MGKGPQQQHMTREEVGSLPRDGQVCLESGVVDGVEVVKYGWFLLPTY